MSALFLDEDGMYVACPYCRTPLTVEQEEARLAAHRGAPREGVLCDACGLDLLDDGAVCVAPGVDSPIACVHCAGELRAHALYCRHCRQWQREPFAR